MISQVIPANRPTHCIMSRRWGKYSAWVVGSSHGVLVAWASCLSIKSTGQPCSFKVVEAMEQIPWAVMSSFPYPMDLRRRGSCSRSWGSVPPGRWEQPSILPVNSGVRPEEPESDGQEARCEGGPFSFFRQGCAIRASQGQSRSIQPGARSRGGRRPGREAEGTPYNRLGIRLDGPYKGSDLRRSGHGSIVFFLVGLQCSPKGGRRIESILSVAIAKPEDLTDSCFKTRCDVSIAPELDLPAQSKDDPRGNFLELQMAQFGEDVFVSDGSSRSACSYRKTSVFARFYFSSHSKQHPEGFPSPGQAAAGRHRFPELVVLFSCLPEGHFGVAAQDFLFSFPFTQYRDNPILFGRSGGLRESALSIGKDGCFLRRLGLLHHQLSQGHDESPPGGTTV